MEEDRELIAKKKAILLTGGAVRVPPDFRPPFPLSRSTAGPGAGSSSIVLAFAGTRVKKAITTEAAEFSLVGAGPRYAVMHGGEVLVDGVEIMPTVAHAPEQAFFNLDTKCIYHCRFCTSPFLDHKITKGLDPDKVVAMILRAAERRDMAAFSGHPSMKKVTIVDEDIDIFDDREVEWAEATRFQASRSLLMVNNAAGSSLDPSSEGTTSKVAIDATKPFGSKGFERVRM